MIAFRIVHSWRMQAVGHLRRFPCGTQALGTPCEDRGVAAPTSVHMDQAAREGVRPPQTVRVPLRVPRSRGQGATPPRAARRWRLQGPNSGRSSHKGRVHPGPRPGTRRSTSSCSRQTGLARRMVSSAASRVARRASSHVIGAWISARRRWDAPPRRWCSAVRLAMRGRRRARRGEGAIPAASLVTAQRSPVGRQARSNGAGATSLPTHTWDDRPTPDWPGLARYGLYRTGPRFGLCADGDVTTHAPLRSRRT